MPLSRMENTTFAMASITDSHDMGLRTVLQSRCPKRNAYSTKTDILKLVQSSKTIIDADSDSENEKNNAASVPTSSETMNVMKSMRNYLDAHSNGEMKNKMDDIKQFVDNLMLKKFAKKNIKIIFQKFD
ncbi:hypothetical protein TNCV_3180821 [Trichonephila clavipes]|nr:hypothetical protein TNCV_3180821 [Trichonephila clavipes]